ncbi:MAG TPA: Hpt domain-containing protein, partial [Thermoguttaceae bacterium]|nr:Hpt domain-containing protein [Thermoguttaceae bacterium]
MSNSEPVARDEFFDSLLGDFLDESGQLLDRLNENLLQLDDWVRSLGDDHSQRCDDELMNDMFRSAHSLKGLSAMLGLNDINGLTHKVENVFDAARKDELVINGDVVELMFQAVDRLVGLVDVLRDPEVDSVECDSVIGAIGELLQRAGVNREQTSQADAERALQDEMAAAGDQTNEDTTAGPVEDAPSEPTAFGASPSNIETSSNATSIDEMPSATPATVSPST